MQAGPRRRSSVGGGAEAFTLLSLLLEIEARPLHRSITLGGGAEASELPSQR